MTPAGELVIADVVGALGGPLLQVGADQRQPEVEANRCPPQWERKASACASVGSSANRKARITPRTLDPTADI